MRTIPIPILCTVCIAKQHGSRETYFYCKNEQIMLSECSLRMPGALKHHASEHFQKMTFSLNVTHVSSSYLGKPMTVVSWEGKQLKVPLGAETRASPGPGANLCHRVNLLRAEELLENAWVTLGRQLCLCTLQCLICNSPHCKGL